MWAQLENSLRSYLNGAVSLDALEDWLLTHLHEIASSDNVLAMNIANRVEGALVAVGEQWIDENEFRDRLEALLRTPTLDLSLGAGPTRVDAISNSSTIRGRLNDLLEAETVHLRHVFG